MISFDYIYMWYAIIIVSGVFAAIARHSSDTIKTIILVVIISLIGFMVRTYQIDQQPIYLLLALALFFIIGIATNHIITLRNK